MPKPEPFEETNWAQEPEAAELAALAAWSGRDVASAPPEQAGNRLQRHLANAELLSLRSWMRHPARSASRLIPLRVKEAVNQFAGRRIFDLSFYLQFQPNSLPSGARLTDLLVYDAKPSPGKKRVALVTPHLGPGGAEAVLYDMAAALGAEQFEILLLATQSRDDRWVAKWRGRVDHVYDLARVVRPERMIAAVCSVVSNWRCGYLVVQNSMYGYAALSHVKTLLPGIKIFDVLHALDDSWDQIRATAEAAPYIDVRIAMSEAVRDRIGNGLLIRNGVDLARFRPAPLSSDATNTILFPARLDPVKRPLLVADIGRELAQLRPQRDFRFVVAGDGPERERFERRIAKLGLTDIFEFRGQVEDLAPLYAACDVVILTSRSEGVPLVILEALASGRPVVASKVGSIPEVLDANSGILIEDPSAQRFAQAVHTLLNDRELRDRMGAAGRRKIELDHDIRETRAAVAQLFVQFSSVSSTSRSTAIE